eukprot:GHVQ01015527.1.p1 GENE.GHVQ01015527.1~~GHVQ01015527.1.p1  ORF type:complete len:917 (+),score=157.43 GHVQ01015527.1:170-2920(+)
MLTVPSILPTLGLFLIIALLLVFRFGSWEHSTYRHATGLLRRQVDTLQLAGRNYRLLPQFDSREIRPRREMRRLHCSRETSTAPSAFYPSTINSDCFFVSQPYLRTSVKLLSMESQEYNVSHGCVYTVYSSCSSSVVGRRFLFGLSPPHPHCAPLATICMSFKHGKKMIVKKRQAARKRGPGVRVTPDGFIRTGGGFVADGRREIFIKRYEKKLQEALMNVIQNSAPYQGVDDGVVESMGIVSVKVSPDMMDATIKVSGIGGDSIKRQMMLWLMRNAKAIRFDVAQSLHGYRRVPFLRFVMVKTDDVTSLWADVGTSEEKKVAAQLREEMRKLMGQGKGDGSNNQQYTAGGDDPFEDEGSVEGKYPIEREYMSRSKIPAFADNEAMRHNYKQSRDEGLLTSRACLRYMDEISSDGDTDCVDPLPFENYDDATTSTEKSFSVDDTANGNEIAFDEGGDGMVDMRDSTLLDEMLSDDKTDHDYNDKRLTELGNAFKPNNILPNPPKVSYEESYRRLDNSMSVGHEAAYSGEPSSADNEEPDGKFDMSTVDMESRDDESITVDNLNTADELNTVDMSSTADESSTVESLRRVDASITTTKSDADEKRSLEEERCREGDEVSVEDIGDVGLQQSVDAISALMTPSSKSCKSEKGVSLTMEEAPRTKEFINREGVDTFRIDKRSVDDQVAELMKVLDGNSGDRTRQIVEVMLDQHEDRNINHPLEGDDMHRAAEQQRKENSKERKEVDDKRKSGDKRNQKSCSRKKISEVVTVDGLRNDNRTAGQKVTSTVSDVLTEKGADARLSTKMKRRGDDGSLISEPPSRSKRSGVNNVSSYLTEIPQRHPQVRTETQTESGSHDATSTKKQTLECKDKMECHRDDDELNTKYEEYGDGSDVYDVFRQLIDASNGTVDPTLSSKRDK